MNCSQLSRYGLLTDTFGFVLDRRHLRTLSTHDVERLRSLVDRHGVVFIRGFGCDADELRTVAEQFGDLQIHPVQQLSGGSSTMSTIVDDASRPPAGFPWHTDLSWLERPPRYGFLQAIEIPDHGGDTIWVDLAGAYRALPAALRDVVDGLHAIHGIDPMLLESVGRHQGVDVAHELQQRHQPVVHPLVRAHPTSGDPLLYLCPMYVRSIVGLDRVVSDRLMRRLNSVLDDPRISRRWSWTRGDVVVWDEAATNHRALTDHAPHRRVMRRCVAGEHVVTPAM